MGETEEGDGRRGGDRRLGRQDIGVDSAFVGWMLVVVPKRNRLLFVQPAAVSILNDDTQARAGTPTLTRDRFLAQNGTHTDSGSPATAWSWPAAATTATPWRAWVSSPLGATATTTLLLLLPPPPTVVVAVRQGYKGGAT